MNPLLYLLEKYPEKPWDWLEISRNPNITMEDIERHPEKPWDWYYISNNPNITMEMIEKYPEKPWSRWGISINPNITIKFIEKNMDKINFEKLSWNKFTYQNRLNEQIYAFWILENTKNRLPQMINRHIAMMYL